MKPFYSTKVTAMGGRTGVVRSQDGLLELRLALPKELGGEGNATNPEQLFAAGYAACFENAIIHATRKETQLSDEDVTVTSTVGLLADGSGGFKLTVSLDITIAGVDQSTAEAIVQRAHQVCPYSNAIRGNVDVSLNVWTS